MSPPTIGETRHMEATLAAQRKQADALERIATVLEKGLALGERAVVGFEQLVSIARALAPKPSPSPKRAVLMQYRVELDAADTGEKAVAVWARWRKSLDEAGVTSSAWSFLRERVMLAERCASMKAAGDWVRARFPEESTSTSTDGSGR